MNKSLISFTKKSLIFIFGFLAIVYLLELAINFTIRRIRVGEYGVLNKIDGGEINADIIVSGSSRALKAVNPIIIQRETGLTCYSIASDGADLGVQLPKLKWYLNRNKKPKILIQDIAQFGDGISNRIYEPFKYLPYLSDDSLYLGLLKVDRDFWIHKYLYPSNLIYYNFDFYSKLFQELFLTLKEEDNFINGFLPDNSKWSANFELLKNENPNGFEAYISTDYEVYLRELKQLCLEKKIIVLFTVLPVYQKVQDLTKNKEAAIEFYSSLEDIPHAYYVDLLDSVFTSDKENFYNFTHVNLNGANKYSSTLSKQIKLILQNLVP